MISRHRNIITHSRWDIFSVDFKAGRLPRQANGNRREETKTFTDDCLHIRQPLCGGSIDRIVSTEGLADFCCHPLHGLWVFEKEASRAGEESCNCLSSSDAARQIVSLDTG